MWIYPLDPPLAHLSSQHSGLGRFLPATGFRISLRISLAPICVPIFTGQSWNYTEPIPASDVTLECPVSPPTPVPARRRRSRRLQWCHCLAQVSGRPRDQGTKRYMSRFSSEGRWRVSATQMNCNLNTTEATWSTTNDLWHVRHQVSISI